jgi:hypothetical protein
MTLRRFASSRLGLALAVVSATTVIVSVSGALGGTTNPQYTGCLSGSDGTIQFVQIGTSPLKGCPKSATQISWSQTGPQGLPGPPGELDPAVVKVIEQQLSQTNAAVQELSTEVSAGDALTAADHAGFLTLQQGFVAAPTVAEQITDLDQMSEQTEAALQRDMDRQSNFLTEISNLFKQLSDTQQTLTDNLK